MQTPSHSEEKCFFLIILVTVLCFSTVFYIFSETSVSVDDHSTYKQFRDAGPVGSEDWGVVERWEPDSSNIPPVTQRSTPMIAKTLPSAMKDSFDDNYFSEFLPKSKDSELREQTDEKSVLTNAPKMQEPVEFQSSIDYFAKGTGSCDQEFAFAALDDWNSTAQSFCEGGDSSLMCAYARVPFLRPATQPNSFCVGTNFVMDLTRMSEHIACLKHRPGYNCKTAAFRSYSHGAVRASCSRTRAFSLEKLSRDHMRDIFDGFEDNARDTPVDAGVVVVPETVLLVTRENSEYANLFHAMSDVINAFAMLYLQHVDMRTVRVLLLDDHPEGPYDGAWAALSQGGPVMRLSEFEGKKVCFERGRCSCVLIRLPVLRCGLITPSLCHQDTLISCWLSIRCGMTVTTNWTIFAGSGPNCWTICTSTRPCRRDSNALRSRPAGEWSRTPPVQQNVKAPSRKW